MSTITAAATNRCHTEYKHITASQVVMSGLYNEFPTCRHSCVHHLRARPRIQVVEMGGFPNWQGPVNLLT